MSDSKLSSFLFLDNLWPCEVRKPSLHYEGKWVIKWNIAVLCRSRKRVVLRRCHFLRGELA